jgi:hypothetical protein
LEDAGFALETLFIIAVYTRSACAVVERNAVIVIYPMGSLKPSQGFRKK